MNPKVWSLNRQPYTAFETSEAIVAHRREFGEPAAEEAISLIFSSTQLIRSPPGVSQPTAAYCVMSYDKMHGTQQKSHRHGDLGGGMGEKASGDLEVGENHAGL